MAQENNSSIKTFRFSEATGGIRAVLERIPQVPGVYAWFRDIRLPQPAREEEYVAALLARINHTYGVTRSAHLGSVLHVSCTPRTSADGRDISRLLEALKDHSFRLWLDDVLAQAGSFLPPLYVGKAKDLRKRLTQHLDPHSPLRLRLQEAAIDLSEITIRCIPMDSHPRAFGVEREVELLLSLLLVPGFTVRYG